MSDVAATSGASIYEQAGIKQIDPNVQSPDENKEELGQKDFLQLMTAQLQNQDPMKPMENGDFLGQMAQFSTVSGLEGLQTSFDQFSSNMLSSSALTASTMVGREVLVPSDKNLLKENQIMHGAVNLPADASEVIVTVKKPSGEQIASFPMGPKEAGLQHFYWDGGLENGEKAPPGEYVITAQAQISNKSEAVDTLAGARVNSVTLGSGSTDFTMHVDGLGEYKLKDVKEIG